MADAFKHLLNAPLIGRMGGHLQRAWPGFDRTAFEARASSGLASLEMKARAMQMADALEATLPADFDAAACAIEHALAPPWPDDRLGSDDPCLDGLEGWALWPVGEFIARRGLAQPDRALQALHALTQRFTAEFAIRPLIVAHPDTVFTTLQRWTTDPSAHVRRLVSEGSRPRLPWGLRLQALVADPQCTAPLLAALQDDPSAYVRRSVANHLNDIAKDHPQRVVAWVDAHLPGASPQRQALLRHASRSLIKQGHPAMLAAWGLGQALQGTAALAIDRGTGAVYQVGDAMRLTVTLNSTARQPQRLVVDYAVHHVKADGSRRAHVFKGWTLDLAAGDTRSMTKTHSLRRVTTRRYHAGLHALDLRINGQVQATLEFELQNPAS